MNYICAVLECSSIAVIATGLERERRKTNIWKLLIYLAVYTILFALSFYFEFTAQISFVGYILFYVYLKLAYKEDFVHTLVVTVLSSIFAGTIEYLVAFIVALTIMSGKQEVGIYEIIVTGLTFLLAHRLSKVKIGKVLDLLEKWDFTYAIVCVLSLMVFAPFAIMRILSKLDVKDYVYIVLCIVVMWLLMLKIQEYKIDAKIRKQYFEAYREVLVQIRRRQHKIKNQINTAYSMFRLYDTYDELVAKQKEYLSKIVDYELPNDAITLEEPSVIALIYEKINEAVDRGIRMETTFSCSMADSRISDVMWVDIIGTLFDNAIEALDVYEGEKKIWLSISLVEKNRISLRVANTFDKLKFSEINHFFEMGFSTKGEGRGVGLNNVKQLVHKHRGEINAMSAEKDGQRVFEIEIII